LGTHLLQLEVVATGNIEVLARQFGARAAKHVSPPAQHNGKKESKLTWRVFWEIDVAGVMKEDFIEKDKDRSRYGWLPKMATCPKGSQ